MSLLQVLQDDLCKRILALKDSLEFEQQIRQSISEYSGAIIGIVIGMTNSSHNLMAPPALRLPPLLMPMPLPLEKVVTTSLTESEALRNPDLKVVTVESLSDSIRVERLAKEVSTEIKKESDSFYICTKGTPVIETMPETKPRKLCITCFFGKKVCPRINTRLEHIPRNVYAPVYLDILENAIHEKRKQIDSGEEILFNYDQIPGMIETSPSKTNMLNMCSFCLFGKCFYTGSNYWHISPDTQILSLKQLEPHYEKRRLQKLKRHPHSFGYTPRFEESAYPEGSRSESPRIRSSRLSDYLARERYRSYYEEDKYRRSEDEQRGSKRHRDYDPSSDGDYSYESDDEKLHAKRARRGERFEKSE
jgi:hypothetical protein